MSEAVEVVSFGCRLNAYESQVMRGLATAAGATDTIIVNTCAVTAEAERQGRQTIRRLRRDRPGARLVVTGCAAQIDPARYAAMPEVDRVLGNVEKLAPESWGADAPSLIVGDIMRVRETAAHLIDGFDGRARAFVEIQQGCDHRCTFCVIPYGRGNSRSVPAGAIVAQIRDLVERGFKEIVLTGVDITSYGGDLPGRPPLGDLARRILKLVPDLPRLRLSSIDPSEIDEGLWALLADEPRLMPHLHLSIQAGDDMILKRMKRRHSNADVRATVARARALRPDIAFGADLIAGFPTETDAHFQSTLDLVADCDVAHLHVFPYSPRAGTPAAKMPAVPGPVIKARAAALRALGHQRLTAHLDRRVGGVASVLVERDGQGRSEDYASVALEGDFQPGDLVAVRLTARRDAGLIGVAT